VEAQEVVALVTLADLAEVQHKVLVVVVQATVTLVETAIHQVVAAVAEVVAVLAVVAIQAVLLEITMQAGQAVVDEQATFLEDL
jgi:hypothetical protein